MKTACFDFELPEEAIALRPAEPRDSARLLEVGATMAHHVFRDLPRLLRPGDALVLNDTRVVPTRLAGRRGEARVEVTLHKELGPGDWRAFARPARRLRPGDTVAFGPGFAAEVVDKTPEGEVRLRFADAAGFAEVLQRHGRMPLPPYIRRPVDAGDAASYQTVYAAADGAVAAPTAGLHFTHELFRRLDEAGIRRIMLTLHVGAGTFLPVKTENAEDHRMHAEYGSLSEDAAGAINATRDTGGRVVAVGSTALRTIETAAGEDGRVRPFRGETELFILPGYRFKAVDVLITNFHLPRSTLFMLAAAFAGLERMKAAYACALAEGYRFYSYGDATLLHRAERT
jgi:S-adenosylmethionine:tRNA ribosyltransferase-isomerase